MSNPWKPKVFAFNLALAADKEAAQNYKKRTDRKILTMARTGAAQVQTYCKETGKAPAADSGIFAGGADAWAAGKTYAAHDLFTYDGKLGFVRQAHTAQESWLPFTAGTESLYGARPSPDENGVYPWAYNMAATVGMQVKDPDDGLVYACIQDIPNLLYKPHMLAAHFAKA